MASEGNAYEENVKTNPSVRDASEGRKSGHETVAQVRRKMEELVAVPRQSEWSMDGGCGSELMGGEKTSQYSNRC